MTRDDLDAKILARRTIDTKGCWIWQGRKQTSGYGTIADPLQPGKRARVHRVAAWLWLGFDLTSHLCVCHSCDTPSCFNPAHLFIGTHADNMRDMARKCRARTRIGEMHHLARLSEEDVRAIRRLRSQGMLLREIAQCFAVTEQQVSQIVLRKQWRHVA